MIFLVLSNISSLYLLHINSLSDIAFANIFSHSGGCVIILLMVSFIVQKLFTFIYFIFAFVSLVWGKISRKILLRPMSQEFTASTCLGVLCLKTPTLIHLEFFVCVCFKKVVQFHPFGFSCLVFPTSFIEKDPFPIVYSSFLCCRLIDHISVGLFLGSSFCSFGNISSSFIFYNSLRRMGINSSLNFWQNAPVKPSGLGLLFLGNFLITHSISLLVIGLFRFSISS